MSSVQPYGDCEGRVGEGPGEGRRGVVETKMSKVSLAITTGLVALALLGCGKGKDKSSDDSSGGGSSKTSIKCDTSSPEALMKCMVEFYKVNDSLKQKVFVTVPPQMPKYSKTIYAPDRADWFCKQVEENEKRFTEKPGEMKYELQPLEKQPDGSVLGTITLTTTRSGEDPRTSRQRFTLKQEDGEWRIFKHEASYQTDDWETVDDAEDNPFPGLDLSPVEPIVKEDLSSPTATAKTYEQMCSHFRWMWANNLKNLIDTCGGFLLKALCKADSDRLKAIMDKYRGRKTQLAPWTLGDVTEGGDMAEVPVTIDFGNGEKRGYTLEMNKIDGKWKISTDLNDAGEEETGGLWREGM
jgi:hypothetical protein